MSRFATLLLVLGLLGGLVPNQTWAQAPTEGNGSPLSPGLRTVLDAANAERGTASSQPEVDPLPQRTDDGRRLYGVFIHTTQPAAIRQAGIHVTSVYPDFVVARVTAEDLRTLAKMEAPTSIREGGVAQAHNDVAAGVSGVRLLNNGRLNNTNYTGDGVIVCVIDSGIDYTHFDFRSLSNVVKSRLLYIWDQTLAKQPGEQHPSDRGDSDLSGFNYGVEYTKSDIEDEIDGFPANFVRHQDTDGHGTHVAGTAAGNGGAHPEQKYKGMAPEADIIAVKAGNETFPFTNVVDGMNYCGEVADDQDKPVVVNMSIGSDSGPHDGTEFQDQAVDNFLSASPGRAVVISAGNEGDSGMHTTGSIASGETETFEIDVENSVSSGEFRADVWMNSSDPASISLQTPSGTTVGPVSPSGTIAQSTTDGEVFLNNETDAALGGGDRQMRIDVDDNEGTDPPPGQGTWTVTLTNTSSTSVTYHTWLWDDVLSDSVSANLVGGNGNYTIGSPGSSKKALTIGAFAHRWQWCDENGECWVVDNSYDNSDDISSFSSIGPLRDGTQKPDIAAPGQGMGSAFSDDMGSIPNLRVLPGGRHRLSQGTSMSAPTTAGAVALLFQEDPSLTQSEIKSTLQQTARTDPYTGSGLPNATWGYGKLDAARAMSHTLDPSAPNRRTIIAHDEWESEGTSTITSDEQIAVQFTPSNDGVASGVLLHPAPTVNLSDTVNAEIWSDNGGLPGSQLGTVPWNHNRIFANTWNYLDLTGAGVNVQKGKTYHVVLSLTQSEDDLNVHYDNGSVDGNSSLYVSGSWSSFSDGDFRMRPVVSHAGVPGDLPVELARFEGHAEGTDAVLSWTTTSETNNAGFVIQRQHENGNFKEIGFQEGAGTTSETQSYQFRASDLDVDTHTFRLVQKDLDGSTTVSRKVTVDLGLSGAYKVTDMSPNPIQHTGTVSVTVASPQDVQATVYNTLGQRVAVLHDGPMEANTTTTMRIGPRLPSGVYLLHVDGESFSTSQKFVRVR